MYLEHKKGFTLIELLVVIAIIGVISSVVLVTLNDQRARSKDTFRLQILKEIQKALEVYYGVHDRYPISVSGNNNWVNDCDIGVVFVIPELVAEGFFAGAKDLSPCPNHWGFSYGSNGRDYKLISHSEFSSVTDIKSFIDTAEDGGPNDCVLDGTNYSHFGLWTDTAKCWREGSIMPP